MDRLCGLDCSQVAAGMSPMKVTYEEVIIRLRTGVCVFRSVLKYLPSRLTAKPPSTAVVKATAVGLKPGPGDNLGTAKPGVKGEVTKDSHLLLSPGVLESCALTDSWCLLPSGMGGADGKNVGVVHGSDPLHRE